MAVDSLAEDVNPLPALPAPPVSRIAFGSCLANSSNAAVLDLVVDKGKPDVFVWVGDNIYGDTEDMGVLKAKYDLLGANPRFQRLWNFCPNLACWDNHDYGSTNRRGIEYAPRKQSQAIFLDFWKVPASDPRRQREGIHHSRMFGDSPRNIQIIQLDNSYFRNNAAGAAFPLLGDAQWKWLAEEIKKPAALRIITAGIQFVSTEHGYDGWSKWPTERQKLFNLIKDSKAEGVVFVSGDQHWSELSKLDNALGYAAYDLTASSLDQAWPLTANGLRVGKATGEANYGMITVDWDLAEPLVHFQIHAAKDGSIFADHAIPLKTLHPWSTTAVAGQGKKRLLPATPAAARALREYTLSGRRKKP
jgi:alkaline phosphatase D